MIYDEIRLALMKAQISEKIVSMVNKITMEHLEEISHE
jgi:hypothetical protein